MKKIVKLAMLLVLVTFTLTGCMETTFKINKDDSFDVTLSTKIREEDFAELVGSEEDLNNIAEEQKNAYEQSGYTAKIVSDDEAKVKEIIAEKHFENLDKIKESILDFAGLTDISITDRDDGKREIIIRIDMTDASGLNGEIGTIFDNFKYTFKLELPYGVEKSNADETSKNKKVLTWEIDLGKPEELTVLTNKVVKNSDGTYSEAINTTMIIIIIGIVVVAVAIAGIVIVLISRKNKKTDDVSKVTEETKTEKEEAKDKEVKGDDETEKKD